MHEHSVKRQRTCIGCGMKSGKTALHRIVRGQDGSVRFDETGRAPGRGAYVCSVQCLEQAIEGRKLARALRVKVDEAQAADAARQLERALEGACAR